MFRSTFSKVLGFSFGVLQYGCIAHCFVEHVAELVMCSGPSMQPTIHQNDILISEHISVGLSRLSRGDIVILRSPSDPKMFVCKRIVGMPGDKVKVNVFHQEIVPKGYIWLEGDNKNNSTDSRTYGAVPQGLVRGRVLCRIWPLNSIQMMTDDS